MRIFLSWSGDASNLVARELRRWLPHVIQAVRPWLSSGDIAKGARWSEQVSTELAASRIGIVCLTPTNLRAPWLLFEAGALAGQLDESRVIPFLYEVDSSELDGPLAQFQAVKFNRSDIRQMLTTINGQLRDNALASDALDAAFEQWWPDLESRVMKIQAADSAATGIRRTDRELLEELVELARSTAFGHPKGTATTLASYGDVRNAPVELLDLSSRAIGILKAANINSIGELIRYSRDRLLRETDAGSRTLADIKDALDLKGLKLAAESDGPNEG